MLVSCIWNFERIPSRVLATQDLQNYLLLEIFKQYFDCLIENRAHFNYHFDCCVVDIGILIFF